MVQLGEKKIEQLARMPIIETRVFKSKDGKYVINKTVITDIRPAKYYEAVLNDNFESKETVAE